MTTPTTAPDEIAALRKIVTTLEALDEHCRERTVRWLAGRYLPGTDLDEESL
ncbi:MAG TPA: hypothetical protein VFC00_12545 [Micromonosporaceae bacterium]|nr:hypothetical protein [Micromonosporaceae bacterium]